MKLIEPLFHWNSRTESFVVGGVIFVAGLCALYLKRRLYGEFSGFEVLIPAAIFIPAQYESLFVTANFAQGPFPLLLMMMYCRGWTCENSAVKYALVLITNFFMIYTGFGLLLGVLTPFLLVIEYRASNAEERPRPRLLCLLGIVLISILSLGSFFLGYKFDPALDCFSPYTASPKYYVAYIAFMWANLFAVRGAMDGKSLALRHLPGSGCTGTVRSTTDYQQKCCKTQFALRVACGGFGGVFVHRQVGHGLLRFHQAAIKEMLFHE